MKLNLFPTNLFPNTQVVLHRPNWTKPSSAARHDAKTNRDDQKVTIVAGFLKFCRTLEVNSRNKLGQTPLFIAAKAGNLRSVEAFLSKTDVDPNVPDLSGTTPLIIAVKNNNVEVVKALLAHPKTNPNLANKGGWTPLLSASERGHVEVVRALLEHAETNPNLGNKRGWIPLTSAIGRKHFAVVKVLFENEKTNPNGLLRLLKTDPDFALKLCERNNENTDVNLEKIINVLEQWAAFVPKEEDKGNYVPDRTLSAETNFYLGELLVRTGNKGHKGTCAKDAVFRFTLALEQIMQSTAQNGSKLPRFAKALLDAAPESMTFFRLDGFDVSRSEIEDWANARGNYARNAALNESTHKAELDPARTRPHAVGFVLEGKRMLEAIQNRNSNVPPKSLEETRAELVAAIGTCRNLNKKLAQEGLNHILRKNRPFNKDGWVSDTTIVLCAMWTYIQNQEKELKEELTKALLAQFVYAVNPMNPNHHPCNWGCSDLILSTPGYLDESLLSTEPDPETVWREILAIAGHVNNRFDKWRNDYKGKENDPAVEEDAKRDMLTAEVMDALINRKGWSKEIVEPQLNKVLDFLKDV